MTKAPRRPRDPAQLAKLMVDIATGEVEEKPKAHAQQKGGIAGGAARASALTPLQRADIARTAANARWKKSD